MSATIELVNERECELTGTDDVADREEIHAIAWLSQAKWTTKQVIATCLWSALFGLGCGYAWLFLQIGSIAGR
jgi:hypothetical protein